MNRYLSRNTSHQLLQYLQASSLPFEYDYEKHRIVILDEMRNEVLSFRLPLAMASPEEPSQEHQGRYVILLIQSGSASIGYFEDGINLDHKVFKSYMVRMKQGTSQIK